MSHTSHAPEEERGTAALLAQILDHLSALLRKEIELARQETSEKLDQATGAIVWLAVSMVAAIVALIILAGAAVLGLMEAGVEPVWAALGIGVILAIIAAAFAAKGIRDLKPENLAPKRTVRTLRENAQSIKESFND